MNRKRLGIAILTGALLGILCIIGVGLRLPGGYFANWVFLIGMWYNRVIMGLVIGLADEIVIIKGENSRMWTNAIVRGLLFGLIVSAAIFLSTHILEIAERMCDRIGIIHKGELIAVGSMQELRELSQGEESTLPGGASLEDIFLNLTGGAEYAELAEVLK